MTERRARPTTGAISKIDKARLMIRYKIDYYVCVKTRKVWVVHCVHVSKTGLRKTKTWKNQFDTDS